MMSSFSLLEIDAKLIELHHKGRVTMDNSLMIWFAGMSVQLIAALIAYHFAKIRNKRGYRYAGIGFALVMGSSLLMVLSEIWNIPFLPTTGESLWIVGWYWVMLGIVLLHRQLSFKGRRLLSVLSLLGFGFIFIPIWISGLFIFFIFLVNSFYIGQWMGHSRKLVPWLLLILGFGQLSLGVEWVIQLKWELSFGGLIHAGAGLIGSMIALFVLVLRVSDVLYTSYRSSITDPLTGLYNRRYFTTLAHKYVDRGVEISVVFVDLDNFKQLNDTQGHKAGDDVLRRAAAILMDETDGCGLAGRYGGEEMVVLVTKEGIDLEEFAEHLRYRIEKEASMIGPNGLMGTASIGFATWTDGMSADELVKAADAAMYHSKTHGKNCVTGYRAS